MLFGAGLAAWIGGQLELPDRCRAWPALAASSRDDQPSRPFRYVAEKTKYRRLFDLRRKPASVTGEQRQAVSCNGLWILDGALCQTCPPITQHKGHVTPMWPGLRRQLDGLY